MTTTNKSGIQIAIVFAIVIIALAFGYIQLNKATVSDADLDKRIDARIERFVAKQQGKTQPPTAQAPTIVKDASIDDDAILGDKDAPVTIIEFSDYECPFCKRHFTQTLPLLKEKYIDTGKVRMVFRDFPLGFHDPLATQQAIAAECAREQGGDEIYFKYHDLLFETTTSNGRGMQKDQLYTLAEQVGVDKAKFTECLDSEKYKDEVKKDLADGSSYGISGTPGFFINGQKLTGAQPFAAFEAIIEAELAK